VLDMNVEPAEKYAAGHVAGAAFLSDLAGCCGEFRIWPFFEQMVKDAAEWNLSGLLT
jgi:hypothetical protein